MFVEECWTNATKGYRCGDSGIYEPYTEDISKLFRDYQQTYGRCKGKVYVDGQDGKPCAIGWVFEKREKYTDCDETYLQETWVMLHEDKPTKTIEYHYHYL